MLTIAGGRANPLAAGQRRDEMIAGQVIEDELVRAFEKQRRRPAPVSAQTGGRAFEPSFGAKVFAATDRSHATPAPALAPLRRKTPARAIAAAVAIHPEVVALRRHERRKRG